MTVINRSSINVDNYDDHYETLVERQAKADKQYGTLRDYISVLLESTSSSRRWEIADPWNPDR